MVGFNEVPHEMPCLKFHLAANKLEAVEDKMKTEHVKRPLFIFAVQCVLYTKRSS